MARRRAPLNIDVRSAFGFGEPPAGERPPLGSLPRALLVLVFAAIAVAAVAILKS